MRRSILACALRATIADSTFSVKIPMKNFFGCIGVAPGGGETRMSITPGEWGGNICVGICAPFSGSPSRIG